ncbi:hypothetical protein HW532_15030 [Kaustia mangrovi]|uniref:Uncharacterized protein n=1 Tax=Kaustia mangrovi TaxID=2593653 RepID=A0A7S8C5Q9_9HYPH|nr:hypothetical protein [Kaustia mangrovi]QPC43886.1 hypothetical protein HW532_15030 [Kaustia mangrovi]
MTERTKRIMREFKIDELSVVDSPAQEGARAVLMKRRVPRERFNAPVPPMSERDEPLTFDKLARPAQETEPMSNFEARVDEIAKRDSCQRMDAMTKARLRYPDEYDAYQKAGAVTSRPVYEKSRSDAEIAFEKLVDQIQTRDRSNRFEALKKAAREHPRELAAYRAALS